MLQKAILVGVGAGAASLPKNSQLGFLSEGQDGSRRGGWAIAGLWEGGFMPRGWSAKQKEREPPFNILYPELFFKDTVSYKTAASPASMSPTEVKFLFTRGIYFWWQ